MLGIWLKGLFAERSGRLLGAMVGVGLTVGLIVAIGTFTVVAARTMTQRAIEGVPVDWQIELLPGTDPAVAEKALIQAVSPKATEHVGYANVAGFQATTGQTDQTTGPGKVLGLPTGYRTMFPHQIRLLLGNWGGVLIAQQTAANLHVGVGDTVTIERIGLPPATVKVGGVVALPNADAMFQAIGLPKGAAPQAPPDNVLIIPLAQWHATFDAQAVACPDSVRQQLHVRLAHARLPHDPSAAFLSVQYAANNFEARMAGSAAVGDNLAARLDGSRSDALYARVLFLFLGVPGVFLAAFFTVSITFSGTARRRREQAMLRTRGVSTKQVLIMAAVEAAVIGAGGVVIGTGLAVLAALGWWRVGAMGSAAPWIAAAAGAGLLLAAAAILLPAWQDAQRRTVVAVRTSVVRQQAPLWQRLFLDVLLLLLAGIVFWMLASSGYQVVVAPEGVPQSTVHYDAFLAPLGLWIGAGLLAMRLTRVMLGRRRQSVARLLVPIGGNLAPVIAASLTRQRHMLARGVVLVALAFAFAVSTAVFNTTFKAQAQVDAALTNGADVTVTGSTAAPAGQMLERLATLPGVVAVQPMMHRYAYVGSDLQDLYGIDPNAIAQATAMSNAYFADATAPQALARLAARPDAVLVSEETVRDFQLRPGDLLNLRLQNAADHQYHVVPFHYVGIAREFPTAPKDSFLVANASYVSRMSGTAAAELVLLRTTGDPEQVAVAAKKLVASLPGVTVTTLGQAQHLIGSSLTSVNLRGLTTIELGFAVMMIVEETGLTLALGMVERRRNFTILAALGAKSWQIRAFLWSEAALVVGIGAVCGTTIGFAVAQVLVVVLGGVFDPPPQALSVPWVYLAVVTAVSALCAGAAVHVMLAIARRPDPRALRRA